jgi:hypothetical protein
MKRFISVSTIFFISISISNHGFSQSSVKGFKGYEKGEFDKATESFTKHLKDDSTSCAALFGLALTYSAENNPAHDYFKAWDCYVKSKIYYDKLTEDERLFFKDFFTARDPKRRNKMLKYNFEYEEKDIEDRLIKYVREENNVEVAEHFLAVYPSSKYYENVLHIRNHIKYRLAEKANTLDAYHEFIKKYPGAAQIPKAINACNKLAFDLTKKENTISAYAKFMKEYPESEQYFDALKLRDQLAFDDAKKINTIESIESFIAAYPKALQLMNARTILRKLLYDRARQLNTLEAYNDFISKYPEGEFYVDIFNLKSSVLGQKIVSRFEGAGNAVVWAKGFDFEEKDDAAGGIAITPDGKTILAGNRQKSGEEGSQTWLISLDNTGKVLWNKGFGSKPYNHANLMTITPQGELMIAGWSGITPDTLARKAWIFKAALNGNGLWEKNIDGNEIRDLTIAPDGFMYMSGYHTDDSARMKTFLLKLNPEAKKIWSRQYLKKGSLEGITLTAKGDIVCAAGRWFWKVEKQGYILYERSLRVDDSIAVPRFLNNQIVLCGSKNNTPLLIKMSEQGIPVGEIASISTETTRIINCFALPNKRLLTLEIPENKVKLRLMDDKGTELKSLVIPNAKVAGPGALSVNQAGEVYLTFTALNEQGMGDICVVKLNL